MKISNEQKQKNRRKIIQAAVDLIIQKGFKAATMREIARNAEVGDATIYNYFPTKDSILFAYYDRHFEESVDRLKTIEGFNEYSLAEQIQAFFETGLDLFLSDREFVKESFNMVFFSLSRDHASLKPIKDRFMDIISDMLQASIEVEEIPPQVFLEMICLFFWDYYIGMVVYWTNDKSDQFTDTTVLIDKSTDLIYTFIKAGVVNKIFDIGIFLFKNHILNNVNFFKDQVDKFRHIKREFTGNADGRRDSKR